jgi:hypothetical protein
MSRYMTPNPRNESLYAPLAFLMAHIAAHFGRKACERTHGFDDRTRRIDDRTRLSHDRTRLLRMNPRGQDDAGDAFLPRDINDLSNLDQAVVQLARAAGGHAGGDWPNDPESRLDATPYLCEYSYDVASAQKGAAGRDVRSVRVAPGPRSRTTPSPDRVPRPIRALMLT